MSIVKYYESHYVIKYEILHAIWLIVKQIKPNFHYVIVLDVCLLMAI